MVVRAFGAADLEYIEACLERNRSEAAALVEVNGLWFHQDPSAYTPGGFLSSVTIIAQYFPYRKGERFLEMGCGVGIETVIAALHHDNTVIAIDINPKAVELTQKNAKKHGVADQVSCRHGDLFSPMNDGEKVDTIFWNWPYLYVPEGYECSSLLERAFCDPGYCLIQRFLSEAKRYLTPGGRIILTFGTLGSYDIFEKIVCESGYTMTQIYEKFGERPFRATYFLYELTVKS